MYAKAISPFNSAFETGIRSLIMLSASHPIAHDLHRIIQYDYIVVHTEDAGGPASLHPPLPLRSGELLVRRGLVETGLRLMLGRGLVQREFNSNGVLYRAEEKAGAFIDNLRSPYLISLRERAEWVSQTFDALSAVELDAVVNGLFSAWTTQFLPIEYGHPRDMFE